VEEEKGKGWKNELSSGRRSSTRLMVPRLHERLKVTVTTFFFLACLERFGWVVFGSCLLGERIDKAMVPSSQVLDILCIIRQHSVERKSEDNLLIPPQTTTGVIACSKLQSMNFSYKKLLMRTTRSKGTNATHLPTFLRRAKKDSFRFNVDYLAVVVGYRTFDWRR
jgi:hypothetical protein